MSVVICGAQRKSVSASKIFGSVYEKYNGSKDFKADFVQTIYYRGLNRKGQSSGSVLYKKNNKLKWLQVKPEASHYISNGKTMWLYLPEDEQVFVNKEMKDTIERIGLLFLSGKKDLLSKFDISVIGYDKDKLGKPKTVKRSLKSKVTKSNFTLEFDPKKKEGFKRALLNINVKSKLITKVTVFDLAQNKTVIRLSNIRLNVGIKDSVFEFKTPKGVDVYSSNKYK